MTLVMFAPADEGALFGDEKFIMIIAVAHTTMSGKTNHIDRFVFWSCLSFGLIIFGGCLSTAARHCKLAAA